MQGLGSASGCRASTPKPGGNPGLCMHPAQAPFPCIRKKGEGKNPALVCGATGHQGLRALHTRTHLS